MGHIMITCGVIFGALSLWLIPHGYHILSKEKEKIGENDAKITSIIGNDNKPTSGPVLYIQPDKIEYSSWSEKEKLDDPEITSRCERIILFFRIRNYSKSPASNVDIKAISSILQEKNVDKLNHGDIKNSYEHNLHFITDETPKRCPFILALDKKVVKYFNDGTLKVKLIINVKYHDSNNNKDYWSESGFIYSPTFKMHAIETYSKCGIEDKIMKTIKEGS